MQKIFRFKYEPCNGTCYSWCDVLPTELNKMPEKDCQETVALMVEAHSKLCDNPEYSFGVDMDGMRGLFVAHYRTPGETQLFSGATFGDAVKAVCKKVLGTVIPKVEGGCTYGNSGSEDLGSEILRACVDVAFRKEHHDACPCHKDGAK